MKKKIEFKIGHRIRRAYKQAGMTQDALAKAIGVDKTTISQWVLNKNPVTIDRIFDIAKACEVNIYWLIGVAATTAKGNKAVVHYSGKVYNVSESYKLTCTCKRETLLLIVPFMDKAG